MEFQLSGHAGTTHSQVLQGTAEPGLFVSFEMVHRDDDVGIGNGSTNFRCLAVFAVDFDLAAFSTFQSVGDDHVTLGRNGIESVFHRALQVIYSIGTAA